MIRNKGKGKPLSAQLRIVLNTPTIDTRDNKNVDTPTFEHTIIAQFLNDPNGLIDAISDGIIDETMSVDITVVYDEDEKDNTK